MALRERALESRAAALVLLYFSILLWGCSEREDDSPTTPDSNRSHYGMPPCRADEQETSLNGTASIFCSSMCSHDRDCPRDTPAGVTATPQCVIRSTSGKRWCALVCRERSDCDVANAARCERAAQSRVIGSSNISICTYDAPSSTPAPTPEPKLARHYGKPPCLTDETEGHLPGGFTACLPRCSASNISSASTCPADVPAGVRATPRCMMRYGRGVFCALACEDDSVCDTVGGAHCISTGFKKICAYAGTGGQQPHYGQPPCRPDELLGSVSGGMVCAPNCTGSLHCPADVPDGVTAKPQCALRTAAGQRYCALACQNDSQCDALFGAFCSEGLCCYTPWAEPSLHFARAGGEESLVV